MYTCVCAAKTRQEVQETIQELKNQGVDDEVDILENLCNNGICHNCKLCEPEILEIIKQ